MLKFQSRRTLVCAKGFSLATLKRNPIFQFEFSTTSSQSQSQPHSFVVSYLINNCGFSQEKALKASLNIHFRESQKPDSVFSFFRNHGFSNAQICHIFQRQPWLLSCDTQKVLLPKFQFLSSKGSSSLDIVRLVTASPSFLKRSLENHIIPTYELVEGVFQSDKKIIDLVLLNVYLLSSSKAVSNVNLLLDYGVSNSNIAMLLKRRHKIFCSYDILKTVEELKQMGFDASTTIFCIALHAKMTVNKTKWGEKVDIFKRWGWSEEQVLVAFRRQPYCMLSSSDKINAVMSFWVEQAGFDSMELVKFPGIFLLSLNKRIVPRASVLQFLISKGLLRNDANLCTPFFITEKLFLEKYVKRFKEDASHLLNLYKEKINAES